MAVNGRGNGSDTGARRNTTEFFGNDAAGGGVRL